MNISSSCKQTESAMRKWRWTHFSDSAVEHVGHMHTIEKRRISGSPKSWALLYCVNFSIMPGKFQMTGQQKEISSPWSITLAVLIIVSLHEQCMAQFGSFYIMKMLRC
ncbi:hypothetical protein L798_02214 [Zootermopsis nevadensis]|uniref:Uncharacterized protein n=1 Tax=Zootermopsis nevadensis TaxID=136037 RepID=A0A067QHY7_ZOONE|nr:hypothetical protein L798_02214 [Zootermopsis nevadensis]